jgi:hypothetical protein
MISATLYMTVNNSKKSELTHRCKLLHLVEDRPAVGNAQSLQHLNSKELLDELPLHMQIDAWLH